MRDWDGPVKVDVAFIAPPRAFAITQPEVWEPHA
jgi:hypothetical protein